MIGNPTDEQRGLYDAVARAQLAGVETVRAGVEARTIDAACRDALADDALAEAFVHGAGHGIGLEIHEQPILAARTNEAVRAGYVVTVEPGVYVPGVGGVRIEDSVVVTDRGCQTITKTPKDPVV